VTTPDAQAKVAQLLAGWLAGGTIVVIDGDMTASAPAEVVAEGNRVKQRRADGVGAARRLRVPRPARR
jgi:hypothetical protein